MTDNANGTVPPKSVQIMDSSGRSLEEQIYGPLSESSDLTLVCLAKGGKFQSLLTVHCNSCNSCILFYNGGQSLDWRRRRRRSADQTKAAAKNMQNNNNSTTLVNPVHAQLSISAPAARVERLRLNRFVYLQTPLISFETFQIRSSVKLTD